MCRHAFTTPQPQFKITIIIENTRTARTVALTPGTIPRLIEEMGLLNGDAHLTEVFIDVDTNESLTAILADLGIQTPLDLL
jgi:hypothetical protein